MLKLSRAAADWQALQAGFQTLSDGNIAINTGDIDLTGLSISSYHLIQFGIGLKKAATGDDPRCMLRVTAAIEYS